MDAETFNRRMGQIEKRQDAAFGRWDKHMAQMQQDIRALRGCVDRLDARLRSYLDFRSDGGGE